MSVAYFVILTSPPSSSAFRSAGYQPLTTSQSLPYNNATDDEELLPSPRDRSNSEPWRPSTQTELVHDFGPCNPIVSLSESPPATNELVSGDRESLRSNGLETNVQLPNQHVRQSSQSSTSSPAITAITSPTTATPIQSGVTGLVNAHFRSSALPWDPAPMDVPQHHTEPTSINTLLAATDPDDPDFVSPFRESEEGVESRRRKVYKSQPNDALSMQEKLSMARGLMAPFMLPLFLVYVALVNMKICLKEGLSNSSSMRNHSSIVLLLS
ncbi:hypothetical protein BGZ83_003304 [Gryganskiella cystojenkinii]|nr:hypothetical protein BGZ83_003304 [Gryganskiella cystojenkinii]